MIYVGRYLTQLHVDTDENGLQRLLLICFLFSKQMAVVVQSVMIIVPGDEEKMHTESIV